MSQDNEPYKEIALLYALISSQSNCKPEIFGKLVAEYDPIINYVIPSNNIFKLDKPPHCAGNTILHVAKSIKNWDVCENLIQIGADITVKDKNDSPLLTLESVQSEYDRYFEFKQARKSEYLQFIDTVLRGHIEFEFTDNPSDKNGISHFHFACMYNKIELIELFLRNGVSVNETVKADSSVYPGYRPLHFAAKYGAVEAVVLLLKFGADTHLKDSKGLNPLHVLIEEKLNTWAQITRRLRAKDDRKNCWSLKSFHDKIERIMTILFEQNSTCFGLYDDTGLSYLHVICTMKNTSLVREFLNKCKGDLEQTVQANSALWPGYTALHFAAHFNQATVRLLVGRGANLAAKDAKGITPFDICLNGMTILDIHSILTLDPMLRDIQFSDGKTMLSEFVLAMRDCKSFEDFMTNNAVDINTFIPFDSPICAGQTPLHLSIICKQIPRNWKPENVDCFFPSNKDMVYRLRVMRCANGQANIYARDARGLTPIHLAFELRESFIVQQMLEFHEVFTQQNISKVVDERGFSLLHIACAVGLACGKAIETLLLRGSNVNEVTESSYTWYILNSGSQSEKMPYRTIAKGSTPLHIAVIVEEPWTVRFLLEHNADILAKDSDGLTPLERSLGTSIFKKADDLECKICDNQVSVKKKKILELLIPRMSDLLADMIPDRMLYCYSLLSHDILAQLLNKNNESQMKILKSAGITKLHVASFTKDLEQVDEQLESGTDVNARVDSTSPLWSGFTPLHIFMNGYGKANDGISEHVEIAKLLLDNGADVSALDLIGNTPLHQMLQCYLNSGSNALFVDMLLGYTIDFSVNPVNPKGLTHLHAACIRDNGPVVEQFLNHCVDINQAVDYFDNEFGGYTALHFAAAYESRKAVDILLRRGANVHCKNVFRGNALHAAVGRDRRRSRIGLLKNLISFGVEMTDRDVFGERPLEKLIKSSEFITQEVEVFLEKGCCVNVWNPITEEGCLSIVLKNNEICPLFEAILKASDIKSIVESRNAIHNIVSYEVDWEEYDDDDPIYEMFIHKEYYTEAIQTLIKLGVNIDHEDKQGYTPLHIAAQSQNITGIIGLLNNGANVNIVNSRGKTAFQTVLEFSKIVNPIPQLDVTILGLILTHQYKLKLIGTELSTPNLEVCQEIARLFPSDTSWDTWVQKCNSEFEDMKSRKIDNSITLHDFWSDTGVVSSYPYMLLDKKNAIDKYFKTNSDNLKKDFPQLVYLLLMQYSKAIARLDLIEPVEASFNFLVGFPMPPICSRIIFRFLSNEDLKNVIISMNM